MDCCSWGKLLSYIWSNDDAPLNLLLHGDKLRDKDRAAIKEKFAVSTKTWSDENMNDKIYAPLGFQQRTRRHSQGSKRLLNPRCRVARKFEAR